MLSTVYKLLLYTVVCSKRKTLFSKKRKSSSKLYNMYVELPQLFACTYVTITGTGSPTVSTTELSPPLFSELSFLITGKSFAYLYKIFNELHNIILLHTCIQLLIMHITLLQNYYKTNFVDKICL